MDAILQQLSTLSDAELRAELKAAGQSFGGIAKTTRKFFEKRLAKHLLATASEKITTEQGTTGVAAVIQSLPRAVQNSQTSNREDVRPTGSSATCDDALQKKHTNEMEESKQVDDQSLKNGGASSDGPFYVIQVPAEDIAMDMPDAPVFKAPICSGRIYQNRKRALEVVKKSKGARFKVFKSHKEADAFMNSHQDLSTPKKTETVTKEFQYAQVSESANHFHSPKNQQLVGLRKAIESRNQERFRAIVWSNPRYLISSGDTPTILKEGPRYNALHVTAIENLGSMCQLILETLEEPQFLAMMYPDDRPETLLKRQEVLVDMYLNTPDKGNCETPLHFASKFGNPEVVKLLVDHPLCDKMAKNKYGETARQIACSRSGMTENTKKRIIRLIDNNYYVPVLRCQDNSTQPVIGQPWSPNQALHQQVSCGIPEREGSPVDASFSTKAYAGPMSPSEANTFHKHLRTPPSAESKRAAVIRRADSDKGLERVARELARSMHVPWAEYWEFLDAYVDIATSEGLAKLEEYLKARQPFCNKAVSGAGGDLNNKAKSTVTSNATDIVSNLMDDFVKMSLVPEAETSFSQDSTSTGRTCNADAMEVGSDFIMERDGLNPDDAVAMTTDVKRTEESQRTSSSRLEASSDPHQSVTTQEMQGEGNLDNRVLKKTLDHGVHDNIGPSAIPTHATVEGETLKSRTTQNLQETLEHASNDKMELSTPVDRPEFGNGDSSGGLMETPKSRQPCSLFNKQHDEGVISTFLMGNEPTKLDLDVLRAIPDTENLKDYPCVLQWRQRVLEVPEDSRKRWPTPAKYRSKQYLTAAMTATSYNLSPTYRFTQNGSPLYGGPPSPLLIGSPYLLRNRHVSDPGRAIQQRRYTNSPGRYHRAVAGEETQDIDNPRLRLFP